MAVTPYQLLGASSARALEAGVADALVRWSAAWCPLPDYLVRCADASGAAAHRPQFSSVRQLDGGACVWAAVPAGLPRWLEQAIFSLDDCDAADGRHLPSPLGAAVAGDALAALLDELAQALTGRVLRPDSRPDPQPIAGQTPEQAPPGALLRHGSGAVVCTVQLGAHALRLLAPPEALPPRPASPAHPALPLAPLHHALSRLPVRLEVELCDTMLTLGHLDTLAVGDVLALPAGIDHPLRVTAPGAAPVCHAHLGAVQGHRAVELLNPNKKPT